MKFMLKFVDEEISMININEIYNVFNMVYL